MKNLKKFQNFLGEWLDSPGSIDVPGQDSEIRVNSRNYTPNNPQMPVIQDAMYEAAYFHDFLDETGKSEEFNKYTKEKRTGREITDFIKEEFAKKTSEKRK